MPSLGSRHYQFDDLMWDNMREHLRSHAIKEAAYYSPYLDGIKRASVYEAYHLVDIVIEAIRNEYLPNSD